MEQLGRRAPSLTPRDLEAAAGGEPRVLVWAKKKHHCNLCGLNGVSLNFRGKKSRRPASSTSYATRALWHPLHSFAVEF